MPVRVWRYLVERHARDDTARVTSADLKPSSAGHPPSISPKLLEPHRLTGDKNITPDNMHPGMNLRGSFKLCLDIEGRAARVVVLQPTGLPSYDQEIVENMQRWTFTPVVLEGKPIPVCTAFTFIFSSR